MPKIFEQILSMPNIMKIICLACLVSPALAVVSVLSGAIGHEGGGQFNYGATDSLWELIFVVISALPASFVSALMIVKRSYSVYLFPFAYLILSVAPWLISSIRADVDQFLSSFLSSVVVGVVASAYLIISRDVKKYFEQE